MIIHGKTRFNVGTTGTQICEGFAEHPSERLQLNATGHARHRLLS